MSETLSSLASRYMDLRDKIDAYQKERSKVSNQLNQAFADAGCDANKMYTIKGFILSNLCGSVVVQRCTELQEKHP